MVENEVPTVTSNSEGSGNDNQNNEDTIEEKSESNNTDSENSDDAENNKAKEKLKAAKKEANKYIDEIHKNKLNSTIRDKLSDFRVDYARGIGTLVSESSSDESSSDGNIIVK